MSNRRMEIIGASVVNGFGDLGQSLGCEPAFRVSRHFVSRRGRETLSTNSSYFMPGINVMWGTAVPLLCTCIRLGQHNDPLNMSGNLFEQTPIS